MLVVATPRTPIEPAPVLWLFAKTATEPALSLPARISPTTPLPWSPLPMTAPLENEKPWTPLPPVPGPPKPTMASASANSVSATSPAFSENATLVVVPRVRTALMAGPVFVVPLCTMVVCWSAQLPVFPASTLLPVAADAGSARATAATPSPVAAIHSRCRRLAPVSFSLSAPIALSRVRDV